MRKIYMNIFLYFKNIRSYINGLYNGRIGRKDYFLGLLFFLLAVLIALLLSITLGVLLSSGSFLNITIAIIGFIISICAFFVFIIYVFSLHIRRLHDRGHNGWWLLLGSIDIWLNFFVKGEKEINKYGEPPIKNSKFFKTIFNLN